MTVRLTLPLRTKNPGNSLEPWFITGKRAKNERGTACMFVRSKLNGHAPPLTIILTRLSAGELDDDSLPASMKHIRDGVADAINGHLPQARRDDARSGLRFVYAQEKCKRGAYGVRIEIQSTETISC